VSFGKIIGVGVLGLLVAVVAVPTMSAGAQTVGQTCSFTVSPDTFAQFPASATVSGSAPAGSHVQVFVQANVSQTPVVAAETDAASDGGFSTQIVVTGPTNITVNFTTAENNGYATGCSQVLGVTTVTIPPVEVAGAAASLAFTGSSNTPSIALIGMAAVVVGLALVVGVRRKARIRS
jgi:LPXTG-motif cell wall-anchored protein